MPNIASLLKDEITRLARKEIRAATEPMRKQLAAQPTGQLQYASTHVLA